MVENHEGNLHDVPRCQQICVSKVLIGVDERRSFAEELEISPDWSCSEDALDRDEPDPRTWRPGIAPRQKDRDGVHAIDKTRGAE